MNTSFYLNNTRKNSKDTKPQSVVLYLSYSSGFRKPVKKHRITLPVKVSPINWDFTKQQARNHRNAVQINSLLDDYRMRVQQLYGTNPENFLLELKKTINPDVTPGTGLYQALDEFLGLMKQQVTPETYRGKKYLRTYLKQFNPGLTWEDAGFALHEKFYHYLCKKGFKSSYIREIFSTLNRFMEWSFHCNYHTVSTHKRFKMRQMKVGEKISLSEHEITRIATVSLQEDMIPVRDVWLFQFYTGQRISDVLRFRKSQLKGHRWIFEQKKTKKRMNIPLVGFSSPALRILEKYDYRLPKFGDDWISRRIKRIAELAGISDPVTVNEYPAGKITRVTYPKYQLISSHTARRSCATILLSKGVPPTTVMDLTGHADLNTLMQYYKPNPDFLEQALLGVGEMKVMMVG